MGNLTHEQRSARKEHPLGPSQQTPNRFGISKGRYDPDEALAESLRILLDPMLREPLPNDMVMTVERLRQSLDR